MDESRKLQIKEATDLAALVEGYTRLKPSGHRLVGLCPLHQERTSSFTVYPDSQRWKCYGCGASGDAFALLQEREGLSFREAVEELGRRAGIDTEGIFSGPSTRAPQPSEALQAVARACQAHLRSPAGARARSYLEDRGLGEIAATFGVGLHPGNPGALAGWVRREGLDLAALDATGILRGDREPFLGRLMFPIADARGRIVGFGGRAMTQARAKYINSPESPAFQKRRQLYGLHQAKRAGARRIVVVEGYTDVLACHGAGLTGAVAALGTSITADHGQALARWASDGVVLLLDGDKAGRAAAERAYAELAPVGLDLRIGLLPEGVDPADLARTQPEQLRGIVDSADDALRVWLGLKRGRPDREVLADCRRVLGVIEDPAERELLGQRMGRELGIQPIRVATKHKRDAEPPKRADPLAQSSVELLACVIARPHLAAMATAEPELGVVGPIVERATAIAAVDGAGLLRSLLIGAEPEAAALISQAADVAPSLTDPEEAFDLLCRQRREWLSRQARGRTEAACGLL